MIYSANYAMSQEFIIIIIIIIIVIIVITVSSLYSWFHSILRCRLAMSRG